MTPALFASPCALTRRDAPPSRRLCSPRRPARRGRTTRAVLITFSPSDFEIRRIVGTQAFSTITDWTYPSEYLERDPLAQTRSTEQSEPAIRLYEAVIVNPPRLRNAKVLLKEFLPPAKELADNETAAYGALYAATAPESDPDRVMAAIDADAIPVATLLGTCQTDESFSSPEFATFWANRFPRSPDPPKPGAPFLVFRWEGVTTAQSVADGVAPTDAAPGSNFLERLFSGDAMRQKQRYARALAVGAVEALRYLHATGGIVHRSVGPASILVNTAETRYAGSLQVKLRDLGFAQPVSALTGGDELAKARKAGAVTPAEISSFFFAEDIVSLGYCLVEFFFRFFATGEAARPVSQDFVKSVFEDTFELDIGRFRDYCGEEPDWGEAVKFLDGCDGWPFVQTLLLAKRNFKTISVQTVAELPFVTEPI